MLIALAGPKGSGKDTAAQPLLDVGFVRINLADELKWLCAEVFDFSRLDMESQEAKERPFDQPLVIEDEHLVRLASLESSRLVPYGFDAEVLNATVTRLVAAYAGKAIPSLRALLQWIGTAFRDQVSKDFWIDLWRDKVNAHRATGGKVVCTDVRYANERQAVRAIGGVLIYIDRPGCGNGDLHASENDFGDPWLDYDHALTNDGDIARLHNRAATAALESGALFWQSDLDRPDIDALHLYFTGTARAEG